MRRLLLIFLSGLLLTIIIYPSAVVHINSTLPDNNDTRLIAYIIGQVQNNLLTGRPLFFGTFFAPYENTLTFSEPFVTTAVLTLPFRFLTSNPITIFNLAYLLNSALTFTAAFIFFATLLASNRTGLLASLIFFLSGFHLAYLAHLQIYSLWPLFLALFFFLRGRFSFFFLFTFVQLTDSLFPVYLIFFAAFIFHLSKPKHTLKIILTSLPFFLICFIFLYPYLSLHWSFPEAIRPIRDAAHFSLGLEEVFTKYHSWTVIILLAISLFLKSSKKLTAYHFLFATGLILSLGPVVKLFGHSLHLFGLPLPLPYTFFYYFFPGFQGFRTPSRFIILALIGAAALIADRLPAIMSELRAGRRIQTLVFLLIIVLLLFEAKLPRPGYAVDATPPTVYQPVKKLPKEAVILELPLLLWTAPGHEIESLRSLYSLEHGRRRLGGYSGFAPLAWIDLVQQINSRGLDQTNLVRLRALGVTHVIENNNLFPLP